MLLLLKLLHLAAAIVWMGGMAFMLWALRPVVAGQLAPPVRLALMAGVLARFFIAVWASIAVLLASGSVMLTSVGMSHAPPGWHAMLGLGVAMMLIFGHLFFGPFRRLRVAATAGDWPRAGQAMTSMQPLVMANFALGWVAIAAVILWQ